MPRSTQPYSSASSCRSRFKTSRLCNANATIARMFASDRSALHSRRNAAHHSHCIGSSRGRNSSGASGRPSHLRILRGADGLAHGSAWLTAIWPPLARLVSSAGPSRRSMTTTSWPAARRNQALATPTTPAPRTRTRITPFRLQQSSDSKEPARQLRRGFHATDPGGRLAGPPCGVSRAGYNSPVSPASALPIP